MFALLKKRVSQLSCALVHVYKMEKPSIHPLEQDDIEEYDDLPELELDEKQQRMNQQMEEQEGDTVQWFIDKPPWKLCPHLLENSIVVVDQFRRAILCHACATAQKKS